MPFGGTPVCFGSPSRGLIGCGTRAVRLSTFCLSYTGTCPCGSYRFVRSLAAVTSTNGFPDSRSIGDDGHAVPFPASPRSGIGQSWFLLAIELRGVLFAGLWPSVLRAAEDDPLVTIPQPVDLSPEKLAEERELIRLLADTLEQVRANYVDRNVSERELVDAAIHGMIPSLIRTPITLTPGTATSFRRRWRASSWGLAFRWRCRIANW